MKFINFLKDDLGHGTPLDNVKKSTNPWGQGMRKICFQTALYSLSMSFQQQYVLNTAEQVDSCKFFLRLPGRSLDSGTPEDGFPESKGRVLLQALPPPPSSSYLYPSPSVLRSIMLLLRQTTDAYRISTSYSLLTRALYSPELSRKLWSYPTTLNCFIEFEYVWFIVK